MRKNKTAADADAFIKACAVIQAQHRLTKARGKKTTDQWHARALQWQIADILKTHRFSSAEDLSSTLKRYVHLYNQEVPQSVLTDKSTDGNDEGMAQKEA